MPLMIRRMSRDEALRKAAELLDRVGLGQRLAHKPGELSGAVNGNVPLLHGH